MTSEAKVVVNSKNFANNNFIVLNKSPNSENQTLLALLDTKIIRPWIILPTKSL